MSGTGPGDPVYALLLVARRWSVVLWRTAVIVLAWIAAVLTVGYMLPWAIAASRGRSNQAAIGIIALVMACQAHQVVGQGGHTVLVAQNFTASPTVPPAGWCPAPTGVGQQYWDGAAWTSHWAP